MAAIIRHGAGCVEPTLWLGGNLAVDVRRLRSSAPGDPASGETLLLSFPAGFRSEAAPPASSWRELFVLEGRLQVGGAWLTTDSYASFPPGFAGATVATPAGEAAVALVVHAPAAPAAAPASPPAAELVHLPATRTREWGYRDLRDGTDRLPLHVDRTRGEATWLLRYPPGYGGCPTRARAVALEVLVLSGEVAIAGVAPPLGPRDYACFPAGSIPADWRTSQGCELLLRTVAAL